MPTPRTTVTVRMYNVGFGDAFVVTVNRSRTVWRMLVDCGVFPAGQTRPIDESVKLIIDDLKEAAPRGSPPHLDVVVATHHHIDHIAGFADTAWEEVEVDEVWVPYVEDPGDPDGRNLRAEQTSAAKTLHSLIAAAATRLAADDDRGHEMLAVAGIFAANSQGDDVATDRLLGRNGTTFRTTPKLRYLPDPDQAKNAIPTSVPGVVAHVLGPSRDPDDIKRMNPPKSVQWLKAVADERPQDADAMPPFDPSFAVPETAVEREVPRELRDAAAKLDLKASIGAEELLAAASILENCVNNTSVYFVLDVSGTRLVFVGDSQYGAWEHVLNNPDSLQLVTGPAFYKVGHHGSHNATPKRYVREDVLGREHYAMMPFGKVKQWPSIPEHKLLDELTLLGAHVIRADAPEGPGVTVHPENLWSEITLSAP